MAAGSIIIDLLLRTGTFETDTKRASDLLKKQFASIQSSVTSLAAALGVGFGLNAFKDFIQSSIDAQEHLFDLAQKAGIAADTLGGIGFAASKSGVDIDSASLAITKLNKQIAEAAAGNQKAEEAFAALGVSVQDASGKTKTADVVLGELASKFASYADGPEKVEIALRLFGKAGADMIPLLNGGGEALQEQIALFKKHSGVTEESTRAAKAFNDTLKDLKLFSQGFGNSLTESLLKPLQAVAEYLKAAREEGGGLTIVIDSARVVFETISVTGANLAFVLIQLGKGMVAVAESAARLAHGDLTGARTIFTVYNEQAAAARKSLDEFATRILNPIGGGRGVVNPAFAAAGAKGSAPKLPGGNAPNTDDPSKKLFENQLKALEALVTQEHDLLQTRNKFLDLYNAEGLLSIQSYFEARKTINSAALSAETSAIDQEIALAKKRISAPGISQVDKADAQGKLEDLQRRRAKVEQQAGEEGIALTFKQEAAYKTLADEILSVTAQVAELGENFRLAAAVKFDLQFDALKKTFTAEGNSAGLQAIATLKSAALAQADFQKATLETSRTLAALQNSEERIALAQQTGALTALDGLIKLGEIRRSQIPVLEAEVQAEEAIAKASGNPALIQNAEAARLALDKLKASADPLAESLNQAFGGDLTSSLSDFVTGTKSAADAFHSFTNAVLNDILKLGAKSLSESLIGGSGGLGGLLSNFLGSGGSGGNVQGIGDKYSGGSSAGGLVSAIAGLFGSYAQGTNYVPETGPAFLHKGEAVIPAALNKPGMGSTTHNYNVTVQGAPGQSRDSSLQQGAAIGLGIQRAMARNT